MVLTASSLLIAFFDKPRPLIWYPPIDVKARPWPLRDFFEVKIERCPEQALVDRQLPHAACGIGQDLCDIVDPSSTPASSHCLRAPPQSPVRVSSSKSPFSAATGRLVGPNMRAPR